VFELPRDVIGGSRYGPNNIPGIQTNIYVGFQVDRSDSLEGEQRERKRQFIFIYTDFIRRIVLF